MGKNSGQAPYRYALNITAAVLVYLVITALVKYRLITRYHELVLIQIGYNIILAVSLNLSAGFLGQLPLGHAGFMSVGAYAAALFTMSVNLPPDVELPIALVLAFFVASAFGVLIGLPALRLRGDYLTIVTLGFGEIIRVIILNLGFTGGAYGLRGIARETTVTWTYLSLLVTLYVIAALIKSRHGRAILSIREDEIAAEASGIPTTYYKVLAFAVSAGFAGVAGGLYAHFLRILDPSKFDFMKSAEILVIVVLGGLGSIFGSVVSATALTILPELLRGFDQYRMVIYSLLLVLVMIFKPSGLCGQYEFSLGDSIDGLCAAIRAKIFGKKGGGADGHGS
ncbi:MAG: branched-chain amino acid ABC transporter permease [Synergistaceae bacterium]|jgi:branched-chain amino acid transport system permease protein|nr:branched-chain amino acid ABC transporter permease [Synergistaceae bacterium]